MPGTGGNEDAGTLVIGNPRAGRGAVRRRWDELLARLEGAGLAPVGEFTRAPGHATELARRARAEGRSLVVAVGGDGTVHEVVNGLLAEGDEGPVPVLGVVPGGSGCDYARTFSLSHGLDGAVACLTSTSTPQSVDVGEVHCQGPEGPHRRLFVNVAEVGIGAVVAHRAARLPRSLGAGRYVASFALTLAGHRQVDAGVEAGNERYEGPLTNLVVAIGQYYGGGMRIAPAADPGDGDFEVQVQFGSKLDYALAMPRVFRGTHLPHPRVIEWRAAKVHIDSHPAARLEADGEILGTTPATFRLMPGALRLKT